MSDHPADKPAFNQHAVEALRLANSHVPSTRAMERCPSCSSELVQPVVWEETHDGFRMLLRCPECFAETDDDFTDAELDRYDSVLDYGGYALVEDLKRLQSANMQEFVARFVAALRAGCIHPEDF